MGEIWRLVNDNSRSLIIALLLVSPLLVGPWVFIGLEVRSNTAAIRAIREDVGELREEIRGLSEEIREDIRRFELEFEDSSNRNHQQLREALINHSHDADGPAVFRAPPAAAIAKALVGGV